VEGTEVTFERDAQREWRALVDPEACNCKNFDKAILASIIDSLDKVLG